MHNSPGHVENLSSLPQYCHHQAQYFAWQLTRRLDSGDEDKLTGAIMDAQIDLNPHQVDAALFAFRNPLSNGVILADEVGLGKTIEAGLIIAQKWAENRRRVLIIAPANLRKQWHQELQDKFGVEATILDGDSYKRAKKEGNKNPFDIGDGLVICSYEFAKAKAEDIQLVAQWDLAIVDEAHRLRNVYKKGNKVAKAIAEALGSTFKVLLTATPLQNSLLELFGMVRVVDKTIFGDIESFRIKYGKVNDAVTFAELKQRISPICKRTLRRDVEAYVKYTKRIPMVESYTPTADEQELYLLVSDYLRRPNLNALPDGQRQLISMVMWKLLASSSFAIAGALGTIVKRLSSDVAQGQIVHKALTGLDDNYEGLPQARIHLGSGLAFLQCALKKLWSQCLTSKTSQVIQLKKSLCSGVSVSIDHKGDCQFLNYFVSGSSLIKLCILSNLASKLLAFCSTNFCQHTYLSKHLPNLVSICRTTILHIQTC